MEKRIIISVHDISPKFEKELNKIFLELNKLKISKKEAFVIFNWENKYNINKNKNFIKKLKKEFSLEQIGIHGMTHNSKKQGFLEKMLFGKKFSNLGEFKGLDNVKLKKIIKSCIILYKKIFINFPLMFVPPRWENSETLIDICKKFKIKYTESPFYMINLEKNKKILSFVTCHDVGDNFILNRLSRVYTYLGIAFSYLFNKPLRYSIHPNDLENGNFEFEMKLLKKLIDKGWEQITTKEFWRQHD